MIPALFNSFLDWRGLGQCFQRAIETINGDEERLPRNRNLVCGIVVRHAPKLSRFARNPVMRVVFRLRQARKH